MEQLKNIFGTHLTLQFSANQSDENLGGHWGENNDDKNSKQQFNYPTSYTLSPPTPTTTSPPPYTTITNTIKQYYYTTTTTKTTAATTATTTTTVTSPTSKVAPTFTYGELHGFWVESNNQTPVNQYYNYPTTNTYTPASITNNIRPNPHTTMPPTTTSTIATTATTIGTTTTTISSSTSESFINLTTTNHDFDTPDSQYYYDYQETFDLTEDNHINDDFKDAYDQQQKGKH